MVKSNLYIWTLGIFIFCVSSYLRASDIAIIAHSSASVANISKKDAKKIFLGKKKKLGGKKITLVDLSTETIKERFYEVVTGKNLSALKRYRSKLIFTGRGRAPKEFASAEEIVNFVGSNNGAVGFVPASAINESVKTIFIVK